MSDRAAFGGLAAVLVAAGAALIALGWELAPIRDEWLFLVDRRGSAAAAILDPYAGQIAIGSSLALRGLAELFGLDGRPAHLLLAVALAANAGLVFAYVRRCAGNVAALLAVSVIAFLGAAHQALLWPLMIGPVISFGAGLGALLALRDPSPRRDRVASALLVVATLAAGTGLAFLAGAAVSIALVHERRRFHVVAVPLAALVAWWIAYGHDAESALSIGNLLSAPGFVYDGFAASIAALLGLSRPQSITAVASLDWGRALLAIAVLAGALRLSRLRRFTPSAWALIAAAIVFWLLPALNETPERTPEESRYLYFGAAFIVLIAAELSSGVRLRRPALAVLGVVTAAAVLANLDFLGHAGDRYRRNSDSARAALAAIEIARDQVPPGFRLTRELAGTGYVRVAAGPYLDAVNDLGGSPALAEAKLGASPRLGAIADRTLVAAAGLRLEPARAAACPRRAGGELTVAAPAIVLVQAAPGAAAPVELGRYAPRPGVSLGSVPAGGAARLRLGGDGALAPWTVRAVNGRVCAPGRG